MTDNLNINAGLLLPEDMELAKSALEIALKEGASKARANLSCSVMDLVATLNGQVDKVTHSFDRSLTMYIYADGRYGTFSTNRVSADSLTEFIRKGLETVRALSPDPCRDLPDISRTALDAGTGLELGLWDPERNDMDPQRRRAIALGASIWPKEGLISEEGEYSDSVSDLYLVDTQGLECRQIETSFEYGVEVTVQDAAGNRYSGYWWDSNPKLENLNADECGPAALKRAMAQFNPQDFPVGRYNMVVENEVAGRLLTPVLNALNGSAIQQQNSFLADSLGKKVFPDNLTVIDCAREEGRSGSRLFDSEGVATSNSIIIGHGVVEEFFVTTYIAAKTGLKPTVDDCSRPKVMPTMRGGKREIMDRLSDGILVTGFNGGNSNPTTGRFSFGVEGFLFKNGKILHPVREAVITGDLVTLWNNLTAAGSDYRRCSSRQVPTLAFKDVDFSA